MTVFLGRAPRFFYDDFNFWAETLDLTRMNRSSIIHRIQLIDNSQKRRNDTEPVQLVDIAIELEEMYQRLLFFPTVARLDMAWLEALTNIEASKLLGEAKHLSVTAKDFYLRAPLSLNLLSPASARVRVCASNMTKGLDLIEKFHSTVELIIETVTWLFVENLLTESEQALGVLRKKKMMRYPYLEKYYKPLKKLMRTVGATLLSYLLNPATLDSDPVLSIDHGLHSYSTRRRAIEERFRRVVNKASSVTSKKDFENRVVRGASFVPLEDMTPYLKSVAVSAAVVDELARSESSAPDSPSSMLANVRVPYHVNLHRWQSILDSQGLPNEKFDFSWRPRTYHVDLIQDMTEIERLKLIGGASIQVREVPGNPRTVLPADGLSDSDYSLLKEFVDFSQLKWFLSSLEPDNFFLSSPAVVYNRYLDGIRMRISSRVH